MNVSRRKTAIIFVIIQSAEFDKFKIFRKIFQKPAQNWENSRSVLSAPEISLDVPIRIESESKYAILIG